MDKKIQIGLYTGETVPAPYVGNTVNIVIDLAYNDLLYVENPVQHIISSRIDSARNILIQNFLEYSTASHLFIMDADMKHPPMMPRMLLMRDKPVISGLYFHRNPDHHYPHLYKFTGEKEDERRGYGKSVNWHFSPMIREAYEFFSSLEAVPEGDKPVCIVGNGGNLIDSAVVSIDGGGFGCILLSREALEKLEPPYLMNEPGLNGDLAFYKKCKMNGIEMYGDMSCIATHNSGKNISLPDFVEFLAKNSSQENSSGPVLVTAKR